MCEQNKGMGLYRFSLSDLSYILRDMAADYSDLPTVYDALLTAAYAVEKSWEDLLAGLGDDSANPGDNPWEVTLHNAKLIYDDANRVNWLFQSIPMALYISARIKSPEGKRWTVWGFLYSKHGPPKYEPRDLELSVGLNTMDVKVGYSSMGFDYPRFDGSRLTLDYPEACAMLRKNISKGMIDRQQVIFQTNTSGTVTGPALWSVDDFISDFDIKPDPGH